MNDLTHKLKEWGIDVHQRVTLEEILQRVESRTGRKIKKLPVVLPYSPSGAFVHLDGFDVDLILVAKDANTMHQHHICLHELAHVICEHSLKVLPAKTIADIVQCCLPAQNVRAILRSNYADEDEKEAEAIATLLSKSALHYVPLSNERLFDPEKLRWDAEDSKRLSDTLSDLELAR